MFYSCNSTISYHPHLQYNKNILRNDGKKNIKTGELLNILVFAFLQISSSSGQVKLLFNDRTLKVCTCNGI